jgi:hypothetical protein
MVKEADSLTPDSKIPPNAHLARPHHRRHHIVFSYYQSHHRQVKRDRHWLLY